MDVLNYAKFRSGRPRIPHLSVTRASRWILVQWSCDARMITSRVGEQIENEDDFIKDKRDLFYIIEISGDLGSRATHGHCMWMDHSVHVKTLAVTVIVAYDHSHL